jgi:ABC-2 type transport system ATP-binding protein
MIVTHDLTKVFSGFRSRNIEAVDHINFEVLDGDIFGFLGQNGAGKTTTIKMLTTILLPTSGTAEVCGYDILKDPFKIKDNVGFMPENPGFYNEMRAKNQLEFYASFYKISEARRRRRTKELLELIGLENVANRRISEFSHGMRKRLALAQALINEPDLLILDEPTGGLDPPGKKNFRELIRELNNNGITIFLSSHILPEVEQICNRVGIIHEGQMVATEQINKLTELIREKTNVKLNIGVEGASKEAVSHLKQISGVLDIIHDKNNIYLEIEPRRDLVPDIISSLVKEGVKIRFAKSEEPDLEDIFESITENNQRY